MRRLVSATCVADEVEDYYHENSELYEKKLTTLLFGDQKGTLDDLDDNVHVLKI